jgi:hypothetical protein
MSPLQRYARPVCQGGICAARDLPDVVILVGGALLLKVRVQGDLAIATYKSTYDSLIKGQHYARTILSTDTFQRQNGTWKQVASHSSQAAK